MNTKQLIEEAINDTYWMVSTDKVIRNEGLRDFAHRLIETAFEEVDCGYCDLKQQELLDNLE
jgi:hypothetical protein